MVTPGPGDSAEKQDKRCTNCITCKIQCTHSRSKGSDEDWKTAKESVTKILSITTLYIPSNDPNVSHELLVEVAKYARRLEETVAGLEREIRAFNRASSRSSDVEDRCRSSPDEPEDSRVLKKALRSTGAGIANRFLKAAVNDFLGNALSVVIRRPEFWAPQQWHKLVTAETPRQSFPEDDLLASLVDIHFEEINPLFGILHAPSFCRMLADGLHLREPHFGAVVLAVCALASRYSDDPRVLLDGVASEYSRGWKWFRQVQSFCTTFSSEYSLHQLQLICLSINFLLCTGMAAREQCWILAGLGIRFAHAAGAHRRSGYSDMDPLTAELYKRTFWVLVVQDTMLSSFTGRSSIQQPLDFDLDLPLALGDSVHPVEQLDSGAFIGIYLQLMATFWCIQEAVYPVNDQTYSQDVVVELDSALNAWLDIIPDHHLPKPIRRFIFDLLSWYLNLRFSRSGVTHQSMSNAAFPSLAICANAARSCGHVLDVQTQHHQPLPFPQVVTVLFDCAVVLLINVWAVGGGPRSRTPGDFNRATADVQMCAHVLRLYEGRWQFAGRKYDIISTMLNVGKYTYDAVSRKRPRPVDVDDLLSSGTSASAPPGNHPGGSLAESSTSVGQSMRPADHLYTLPLHAEELGRLYGAYTVQ
ncbi:fungal-specific transcription factor domain-containing protein [Mycena polygramma]|nr:fungal-specific transcription factor domain-containing protein [Mycena polygramma]